ncbi:hypothetical protein OS493_005837 [Desmophyllum pertusum]|uniref:Uncharacterized protein n=1 Tax=Desmophyllum pertusum TaxID=174260 RepID=A0A9W9YIR0_9CNID|nr:hypothetical protein OS493_005837 [Desmophyllum pertusum]
MADWSAGSKERKKERVYNSLEEMNYCPETVLVHSAFLLANNVAARSLNELERGKCSQAVQIISGAIREITQESLLGEKLLQVEVRQLEFKIHSWLFSSLFSSYGGLECGELSEEEYFDSFPPLPQIGVGFYLELVQEVGWSELLVEVCGDAGTTPNAAEVHGLGRNLLIYSNVLTGYQDYTTDGRLRVEYKQKALSDHVTYYISHERVEVTNHRGYQAVYDSKYLFVLDGRPIGKSPFRFSNAKIETDIWLSMNRVISRPSDRNWPL